MNNGRWEHPRYPLIQNQFESRNLFVNVHPNHKQISNEVCKTEKKMMNYNQAVLGTTVRRHHFLFHILLYWGKLSIRNIWFSNAERCVPHFASQTYDYMRERMNIYKVIENVDLGLKRRPLSLIVHQVAVTRSSYDGRVDSNMASRERFCNMASGWLIGQSINDLASATWWAVKLNERSLFRPLEFGSKICTYGRSYYSQNIRPVLHLVSIHTYYVYKTYLKILNSSIQKPEPLDMPGIYFGMGE